MKAVRAMATLGIGLWPAGRMAADHAARYETYLISAQACGVSLGRAKAIFAEEPYDFDEALQRATIRVCSGEEAAA